MTLASPFRGRRGCPPGRGRAAALLLALVCLQVLAGPAASEDVPPGAHAGLTCGTCHVVDAADRPLEPIALTVRQETLCAGCHAKALGPTSASSHPSGFVPARALPDAFPLDAEGRLTCNSCHDLHGGAASLLRGGGVDRACLACHSR